MMSINFYCNYIYSFILDSVIAMFGGQLEDIGKDSFVRAIKKFTSQTRKKYARISIFLLSFTRFSS